MVTVRYCPSCGTDRRAGDRFCGRCGTALGGGETTLHASSVAPTTTPTRVAVPPRLGVARPPRIRRRSAADAPTPPGAIPPRAPDHGVPQAYGMPPQLGTVPSTPGAVRPKPVALLGATVIAVSALPPWFTGVASSGAFGVDAASLVGSELTGNGFPVAALLLPIGATAGGLALRGSGTIVRRLLGGLALAIAALFLIAVSEPVSGAAGGSVMDLIGVGPFVTAAGSVALVVSR